MAVTQQMVLVRVEDIAGYAEARGLARRTRELLGDAAGRTPVGGALRLATAAVAAAVAEGLRGWSCEEEVRRFRQASLALAEARASAWEAYEARLLPARSFDELMAAAGRCEREVLALEASARHRARRRIDSCD